MNRRLGPPKILCGHKASAKVSFFKLKIRLLYKNRNNVLQKFALFINEGASRLVELVQRELERLGTEGDNAVIRLSG